MSPGVYDEDTRRMARRLGQTRPAVRQPVAVGTFPTLHSVEGYRGAARDLLAGYLFSVGEVVRSGEGVPGRASQVEVRFARDGRRLWVRTACLLVDP